MTAKEGSLRDYQRLRNNKYLLPKPVYHQALWIIRDHKRIKSLIDNHGRKAVDINAYIRSNDISDPTFEEVNYRERYLEYLQKIEDALSSIPNEYAKGVWNNIVYHSAYPKDAHRSTYGRYKAKFIYAIAERFELI